MLIEMLELEEFNVLSANTDGIICQFHKNRLDEYYKICHKWEEIVGNTKMGQLEYTDYSILVQTSVNDYIAVKTSGSIKTKGDFEIDKDIHKDHSMRIIRIAMMRYFVYNIPVKETIENHLSRTEDYEDDTKNNSIYDFCLAKRALRGFKLETHELINSEKVITQQQKNTRYFISNKGKTFYKRKAETGKMERINVGYEIEIFNRYVEKEDYNINYQFYIRECNKIIDQIENKQLKLLF